MVLIVSEQFEMSTSEVMEWIDALGGEVFRLNGSDFFKEGEFSHKISLEFEEGHALTMRSGEKKVQLDDIEYVWFRRDEGVGPPSFIRSINDKALRSQVSSHVFQEMVKAKQFIYKVLSQRPHIGNPIRKHLDKFTALQEAVSCGIRIPATILTDDKDSLLAFRKRYGQIITKAISDSDFFEADDGNVLSAYTNEVTEDVLEEAEDQFCVTLAQEMLQKDIEIRTFYLFGKCYSMAIFSQLDEQTNVDFRRYNIDKPNRSVPYKLPLELESKIDQLMQGLGLSTGSLDFVKTQDGDFVFLEVNPVGQFGMVSKPCNYPLEKIIAAYTLSNSKKA